MPADITELFVFDNGSLAPEATLQLRQTASELARALGRPVRAVSLLHSDKVAPSALGGEPAALLGGAVRAYWEKHPEGGALLLPAFFGPSRALTHSVPRQMRALAAQFPRARWRMAPCLVDLDGDGNPGDACGGLIAQALADAARRVIARHAPERGARPKILLVDHGSPERAVTAVREFLGARVREILRADAAVVGTASMERRAGGRYDFNEPLLGRALRASPFDSGDVVVLLQFLTPGRHAGTGGDVAAICEAARAERAHLRTWIAEPIGLSPHVAEVLRRRAETLVAFCARTLSQA